MPSRGKRSRIDAQWQALQPGWGPKEYDGERKMLHKVLDDGEGIERLASGAWRNEFENHDKGIVVATEHRVIFLNRGRLSRNVVELAFWEIATVNERGHGELRIVGPGGNFRTKLRDGAAAPLVSFIRSRLLTDESVQESFSHVLESGETVEFWAHCSAGEEIISKLRTRDGPDHDHTDTLPIPAVALATDRRIFVTHLEGDGWRHGTILAVEYWGGRKVRLVDSRREVHVLQVRNESAAEPFVAMMREHTASAERQVSGEQRISAQWKLQHPLWSDRENHRGEREKLGEVLPDGEQIEAMVWGHYQTQPEEDEYGHRGIIAATRHRLLFVSNGWLDQHVSQLPYGNIAGMDGGRVLMRITATPGHVGYTITEMDEMNPHDSREKGQPEEFAKRLKTLVDDAHRQPSLSP